MVTHTNHVIARAGFTLREAFGTLKIFATSSCQMLGEDKKKSYHLSVGLLAGTVLCYGKSGPSYCITVYKMVR